jgi:hypothetical protein
MLSNNVNDLIHEKQWVCVLAINLITPLMCLISNIDMENHTHDELRVQIQELKGELETFR